MPIALQRAGSVRQCGGFLRCRLSRHGAPAGNPCISPSSARITRCGYHAFWCAANPVQHVDFAIWHTGQGEAATSPSGMANTRTQFSHLCDNIVMTRFLPEWSRSDRQAVTSASAMLRRLSASGRLNRSLPRRPDRQSVFPYTYRAHSGSSLYRRPPAPPALRPDPHRRHARALNPDRRIYTASPWPVPDFLADRASGRPRRFRLRQSRWCRQCYDWLSMIRMALTAAPSAVFYRRVPAICSQPAPPLRSHGENSMASSRLITNS